MSLLCLPSDVGRVSFQDQMTEAALSGSFTTFTAAVVTHAPESSDTTLCYDNQRNINDALFLR
jgi:hypothetical protein